MRRYYSFTWIAKNHACHLLGASVAASLMTRKVGVSVDAQEGCIRTLCSVCSFVVKVYIGYSIQTAKNCLLQALVSSKIGFVIYLQ